ncbi:RNP domain protein [Paecilomyces variotii No. 5]|uniref:RNP domain protein n=1 Tax=Byssochlamys spectabilis (strain No. 5 / NBRC 109023) TaxID=1356009 RepID=V5FP01_BYSSN|nr:RNP domain protein [Paecilomyces variotii No. 5]
MSYPPPAGLNRQPPSSLPPRPPPPAGAPSSSFKPAYSAAPSYASSGSGYAASAKPSGTGYNAFTAFQPRSVASTQPYRTSSPVVSAPPASTPPASYPAATTGYGTGSYQYPQQSYQSGPSYYGQAQYGDSTYGPTVPQIQNPFPLPGQDKGGRGYGRNDSGLDPDTEAQIAQWQSAYMGREADPTPGNKGIGRRDGAASATGANTGSLGASRFDSSTPSVGPSASSTPVPGPGRQEPPKTVVRSGGGQSWTDPTLLEWDPAHFRLFVGNLAGEVTDDSLLKAFSRYPSVQKARVIRDKRTEKSKGYGFVSFSDGDDYLHAAREMQGKYIGSHPVLLRRATTEVRPVANAKNGKKGGGGARGHGGNHGGAAGKVKHDGVKKQSKTKGGLKMLG